MFSAPTHDTRHRSARSAWCIAIVLALGATWSVARAQTAAARFAGDYKYSGTKEQGLAIVDHALDYSLSDYNMIERPAIKLMIGQRFSETIHIEIAGTKVTIKVGDYPPASTEIGKTVPVKSDDGKSSGTVGHTLDGNTLTETLSGDKGTITNAFELSSDGKTLQRSVTVKGDNLKKAIRYKLQYVRK